MERTVSANVKAEKKQGDDNKLRQAVSRKRGIRDRFRMQINAKGGRFNLSGITWVCATFRCCDPFLLTMARIP